MIFAENLEQNVLLKQPHCHGVFTIPKRFRCYFKFDRKLLGRLYTAAWESWKELVAEQCPTGTTGAVMALHTAGDLLGFHPHIHTILLTGAILPDGSFQPVTINSDDLQLLFAAKVRQFLLDAGLLTQEIVDSMQTWKHSGFNVFLGEPIAADDSEQRLFFRPLP